VAVNSYNSAAQATIRGCRQDIDRIVTSTREWTRLIAVIVPERLPSKVVQEEVRQPTVMQEKKGKENMMCEIDVVNRAPMGKTQNRLPMSNLNLGTTIWGVVLACAVLVAWSNPAMAQAGKLDPAFGTGGTFISTAGEFNNTGTFGNVVALQSDGKIVAAGQIGFASGLLRLTTNGTLDQSFGNGGVVIIPGSDFSLAQIIGVAIQSDGKIVVGSSNLEAGFGPLFMLARLNVNGSLDTTFDGTGIVETQIGSFGAAASVLALQPDGKILLAGQSVMARYDANGQLDDSFGNGGEAAISVSGPTAIALQPDGKILLAAGEIVPGTLTGPPGLNLSQIAGIISRYNANGSLDTSFGASGQAASVVAASAIAVQTDGVCLSTCKILVGGSTVSSLSINNGNAFGFGLSRLTSNGSVDATFGTNGVVATTFPSAQPQAVLFAFALQTNGDIVAGGTAGHPSAAQTDFALARYTGNGQLDTAFGSAGTVTTTFGTTQAAISAVALQSDGKIVAVGGSQLSPGVPTGKVGFIVTRYLGH
jgi:uncharacterized delta-60 repeat protein